MLTFGLSVPFFVIGAMSGSQLLPGLPASSLAAFCPLIAASFLVRQENGIEGVKALLKRAFDYKQIRAIWYAPIILLFPAVMAFAYVLMRVMGSPLPEPQFPVLAALLMFMAFFIAAVGEEVGWSGYALDPMQERWSALEASVLLGMIWAAWHIIPLAQAHRSLEWIAWWSLATVATRILMVWLYNNTGKSVFATVLFHAISNLSWQLFPNYGSHYDPRVVGPILAFLAVTVAVCWGQRTLARYWLSRKNHGEGPTLDFAGGQSDESP